MPPVRGCPVTFRHGWEQLRTRVSTTCVRNNLSHIGLRGHITACLKRELRTTLLYISGQLARTSRAWSACRSRLALAVYGGLDFIFSKWASYFSCRSLICNPLMSLRSHCSKVASFSLRLKATGSTGCTALQNWNGC
jgi:hypothetical protein